MKINFNDNWVYFPLGNESQAKTVDVPHDAMIFENRTADSMGGRNIGWFEALDYVYEKSFFAAKENKDKFTVFEFEGVYHNAEVYINDKKAAFRPYGYTNFYVEANEFLNYGAENKIKVVAKNSDQPNSRWYSGTGIYRPVSMYVLPTKHININGLKVKTIDYKIPKIEVSVESNSSGKIQIEILDECNVIHACDIESSGSAKVIIELENAKLWNAESPNLYTLRATFEEDINETTFGVRLVECDSKNGLRINGKNTLLLGACVHHDNGLLGAKAHPFAEYRKVKLLKESGFNAIRSAHNPCSKAMLDACDKLGMLVMDEYVDMWYIHKNKYDYANYVGEWWQQDLTDMVNKDYNHPSVIMYSIGNEVSETGQERGIEFCGEMTEFLKSLDDRLVTCGVNIFFNYLSSLGFGVYSDKKADKEITKKKKKAVGSEFFNNLAGIFGDKTMKIGASLRGSDRKSKKSFAKLDVAGYNYGILRYKKDFKKYPDRVIVGSETFCSDAYNFYEIAKANKALIGDFVWAGMDYIGEVGIGAWEYAHYVDDFSGGVGWMTAGSGRIDITGKANCEAAYMKVAYEKEKISMGVIPVDSATAKHSPSAWKMTNALNSWSFCNCKGLKTIVEVYVKASKVALFLNNKKIGEKKTNKNCRVNFSVRYATGQLTAIAYDLNGKEIARTSLVSAADETKLILKPETETIKLDTDLSYIRLKFTDNEEIVKPLVRGEIKVIVENGELIGLGNGCAFNARGYITDTVDTYYGEALAIVKPLKKGTLKVTATSAYGKAETEIEVL